MATHDHKARARLSVPADSTRTPPPDLPVGAHQASPPPLVWTREDLALALYALTRLRIDHERYLYARAKVLPIKPPEWPLSAMASRGLAIAIQCLECLVDGPGPALRVNA